MVAQRVRGEMVMVLLWIRYCRGRVYYKGTGPYARGDGWSRWFTVGCLLLCEKVLFVWKN